MQKLIAIRVSSRLSIILLCFATNVHLVVYLDFDVDVFASQQNKKEGVLDSKIVNISVVDKPTTIVDIKGHIVIWCLPEIIPYKTHVGDLVESSCLFIID